MKFVIMAGLPGTGKTALAEALAERLGGVVLSKDEVRAALFPRAATEYSDEQDDFCMTVIVEAAKRIAAQGKVPFVFFDGRTFSRGSQIEQVVRAAAEAGVEFSILHLQCGDELAVERIRGSKHVARNRDEDLYWEVKSRFEAIMMPKLDVDTSRPLEECVARCAEYLKILSPQRTQRAQRKT